MEDKSLPRGLEQSRMTEARDRVVVKIHARLKHSVTMGTCNTVFTTEEMNPALTARLSRSM